MSPEPRPPRGSVGGGGDRKGKPDVLTSTALYTADAECPTCGHIRIRIRVCSCNHEAVYHDPPGKGRCVVGAGLTGCDCPGFDEDMGDVA